MFSIVTVPSKGLIFSAHGRPTASKAPPGGNGTTSRIGRDGYDCAQLSWLTIVNADTALKRRVNCRRSIGICRAPRELRTSIVVVRPALRKGQLPTWRDPALA